MPGPRGCGMLSWGHLPTEIDLLLCSLPAHSPLTLGRAQDTTVQAVQLTPAGAHLGDKGW